MSIERDSTVAAAGETLSAHVQVFRLVLALAQELRTLMDRRLQPSGVTTQQAALLTAVEILGQPALTETARALAMTHQNVKQLATVLERKGFIEIVQDEHDARSKRLVTTRRHKAFWAQRNADDHASVAAWFADLSEKEIAALVKLLARAMGSVRVARSEAGEDGKRPALRPRAL
jgi:DNA-binding MarR family transcriptional regulator